MRPRDTLLGLLVLSIVVAGVVWTRGRSHHAATGGSGGPASPPAVGPADTAIPDLTGADATADVGDLRVTMSVSPRPPVAFRPLRVRVRLTAGTTPVPIDGRVSFEMTMPMGDHRYALVAATDGWYVADVVLPFCPSGNPRWYALVEGTAAGRPVAARFRLDLTREGPP